MFLRRVFILISLLVTSFLTGSAQPQCTVTRFDEMSGGAQFHVTQIVQDQQGLMWFSTWQGLHRYDGYEFKCFKSQAGDGVDLPSDRISDMFLDKDGNLICQIDNRVFLFDVKTCQYKTLTAKQEDEMRKSFQKRLHSGLSSGSHAPFIYTDQFGVKWAIHRNGQLYYDDNGSWILYSQTIDPTMYLLYGLTDHEENLWMRSDHGAYRLSFWQYPFSIIPQEKPGQMRCFYVDSKQRYWMVCKDDATIRLFDKTNHLLGYLGRDGQIHAGYTSFGVPVYHIMQDSKGTFWLCSKPGGLFRLKENTNSSFIVDQFLHQDGNKNSLNGNELYFAKEDQLGRIWIASFDQGINCIVNPQDEQPEFLHKDNGLKIPNMAIMATRHIHLTEEGVLLAATKGGLLIANVTEKNPKAISFKLHTRDAHRASSLSNNATMYIMENQKKQIFICTESGGLNQIVSNDLLADQLDFKHYNTSTGFPSDVALSAIENNDYLLVVSNDQLIKFYPDQNVSFSFDADFWHHLFRFSEATPVLLPDGRLLLGTQERAFTIKPEILQKSDFAPPIIITSVSIHNGRPDIVVNSLDTLRLLPTERDVTINFAALDYAGEGHINYAFQMGEDSIWNNLGRKHSATFLNLKPGEYTLKIRSTNSDGVWTDNTCQLTIIVEPTFWETGWAQLLYLLFVVMVILGVFLTLRHIARLNKRQKELHEAYLALVNQDGTKKSIAKLDNSVNASIPRMKPEDEAFMQRAIQFIEEHLDDPEINIGDMAEATATSRSALHRKMKSLLGVTPLDFIHEARIRKACQLLREGALVKDVAYKCGFSDAIYFRKCFKAETGKTPSEYRDENCGD